MQTKRIRDGFRIGALLLALLYSGAMLGQAPRGGKTSKPAVTITPDAPAVSNEDSETSREEFMRLLRPTPRLVAVVAADPSLLANNDYIAQKNPALAQFLLAHPQIPRSPEFYLFADNREGHISPRFFPEMGQEMRDPWARFWENEFIPFLVFLCILGALLWVLRVVLENRRWGRRINMQSDTHTKLLEMLEKFSSNEELLAYMRSEAGKRFMDAAILSSEPQASPRNNALLNRVLTPLQAGIVLLLAGAGVWTVHMQTGAIHTGLGVLGMLGIMVGLGFIIAAIVAWGLGRHLGLLPVHGAQAANGNSLDAGSRP